MKTLLPILFLMFVVNLQAQITLTYADHCYTQDENYWFQLVEFQSPGQSGEACVWNFSGLKELDVIDGEINTQAYAVRSDIYPKSSLAINENGNTFVYSNSDNQIVQLGYQSGNSTSYTTYSKPFVKLKFPFTYQSKYSGEVALSYSNSDYSKSGNYTVESDAYGLIVLPNGKSFKDALRVHTRVVYDLNSGAQQVQDIYRWYVKEERFPVMVLQDLQIIQSTGKITHDYKAAYNKNTYNTATLDYQSFFTVSPNPVQNQFEVTLDVEQEGKVSVDLYNLEGRFIYSFYQGVREAGPQIFQFTMEGANVSAGAYLLKVTSGEKVLTESLVVQK